MKHHTNVHSTFTSPLYREEDKHWENLAENAGSYISKNATKYHFDETLLACLIDAEVSETPHPQVAVQAFKNCNL